MKAFLELQSHHKARGPGYTTSELSLNLTLHGHLPAQILQS